LLHTFKVVQETDCFATLAMTNGFLGLKVVGIKKVNL
jgi:hypothetical protein